MIRVVYFKSIKQKYPIYPLSEKGNIAKSPEAGIVRSVVISQSSIYKHFESSFCQQSLKSQHFLKTFCLSINHVYVVIT